LSRRWVEHTGELELEIEAAGEGEAFEEAFDAMRELLAPEDEGRAADTTRAVSLHAPDRAALLADWLAEIAFLAETEGLVPTRLASLELLDDGLEAVIEGFPGEPAHLVKAATYHRLAFERVPGGVRATVVLDV
jgi:SHS2 domain-containing protein